MLTDVAELSYSSTGGKIWSKRLMIFNSAQMLDNKHIFELQIQNMRSEKFGYFRACFDPDVNLEQISIVMLARVGVETLRLCAVASCKCR